MVNAIYVKDQLTLEGNALILFRNENKRIVEDKPVIARQQASSSKKINPAFIKSIKMAKYETSAEDNHMMQFNKNVVNPYTLVKPKSSKK